MILPPVKGKLDQSNFFVFAACDSKYFDEFGKPFVNSVLKNTNAGVHIHLFDPQDSQIDFCQNIKRVSFSYEFVDNNSFTVAADRWKNSPKTEPDITRHKRILTAMSKGNDKTVNDRIQKTYYACARFIRLEQLTEQNQSFFAMDIDAIVRKNIPHLPNTYDCYLYKITGKKARVLAGGMYSNGNLPSRKFLKEYSELLINSISNDYIYWSMDQDILDVVVPKYNIGDLPISLIDWDMSADSIVWTAKGLRKDSSTFISEKKKYMS